MDAVLGGEPQRSRRSYLVESVQWLRGHQCQTSTCPPKWAARESRNSKLSQNRWWIVVRQQMADLGQLQQVMDWIAWSGRNKRR